MVRQPQERSTPLWLWPNLLGLDAPLVAVSWQILFARCFEVELPLGVHFVLGLSVWCIYLADRLYDVYRAENFRHATPRLSFTKQHFKVLSAATALAGCMNLYLIFRFIPGHLLVHGLITAGLLAVYYAFRFGSSGKLAALIPREIMCGMVFAIGSAIATFSYRRTETSGIDFIGAVAMLGLICSASCILISVWERDEDLASGDRSIASENPGIPAFFPRMLVPLFLLFVILAFTQPLQIYLSGSLSALALYLMVRFEEKLSPTLLRVLADWVLLTPLLFIAFT